MHDKNDSQNLILFCYKKNDLKITQLFSSSTMMKGRFDSNLDALILQNEVNDICISR